MHFSKNKIIALVTILGLFILTVTYFYHRHKNEELTEIKKSYEAYIDKADLFKDIQLDSAHAYAKKAYDIVQKEPSLEFEKNTAMLTLSNIDFLRSGARYHLYENVEKCEEWFKKGHHNEKMFDAMLVRLRIKEFLKGSSAVRQDANELVQLAIENGNPGAIANAYYFKMRQRDFTGKWEDDVHILDSARLFALKVGDSALLGKIRILSVLPINGQAASFDSTFLSLQEADRIQSSELKCLSYQSLGLEFMPGKYKDSANYYLELAQKEAIRLGSTFHEGRSEKLIGMTFFYASDTRKSILYSERALKFMKQVGHVENEWSLSRRLAQALYIRESFSTGLKYARAAVDLSKQLDYKYGMHTSNRILLNYLLKTGRIKEARIVENEIFDWAKNREENFTNQGLLGDAYLSKGEVKNAQNELDSALYYYRKAIKTIGNAHNALRFKVDIAILTALTDKEEFDNAQSHLKSMLNTYHDRQLKLPRFVFCRAKLSKGLGRIDEAIFYLNEFLDKDKFSGQSIYHEAELMLSELHASRGEFRLALKKSQTAQKIKNKIDKANEELKLEKLQSQYELAQKESKIQQLDIERLQQKNNIEAQENKLETRKLYIIFLISSFLLLVVVVISIIRRTRDALLKKELQREAESKERQIERLKAEESKRAIELKNQLFANISHEFRTPLTLINAPVEKLMENADQEKKKSLNVIRRNADHLLQMVDEILELSHLDAGETVLSKRVFELNGFIQKIQLNFESIFAQKSIAFEMNLPSDSLTVLGDEYRLKMVLNNLLKNAFHHTPKYGEITLNVEANSVEGWLNVDVINTGDPINPDFLLHIFDRYARSNSQEYSGYGIGLSFCKKIIELHEGIIVAENTEYGVKLSFSFPTSFNMAESVIIEENSNENAETKQKSESKCEATILIVEDNLEVQNLLKEILSISYKLLFANNGQEGIELAREEHLDLIVSDIMMPKVDGMKLVKTLKDSFSTSHIPIILLTAKSTGHDKIAGLQTGVDDYLTKPFSPKELLVRVDNLLKQREQLRKRYSKNIFLLPEEITSTSLDQEFLENATKIIENNLQNPDFNVGKFCRELALNRNSVHQKLKSLTSKSASQFIKSVKLKKAAVLLADERLSIIEVSELSGFNNRQAFYKAFKEQFEMTPTSYRMKCLENYDM